MQLPLYGLVSQRRRCAWIPRGQRLMATIEQYWARGSFSRQIHLHPPPNTSHGSDSPQSKSICTSHPPRLRFGTPEMSKQLAARKKGSPPSAAAAAAVAAPATARTLGRGGLSTTTAFSLSHGGSSAPTARNHGLGGGSAAAAVRPTSGGVGMGAVTAPSSIDGSSGGGFPSSSLYMDGFPFPPSPSPALFDAAGADPSSPGSW